MRRALLRIALLLALCGVALTAAPAARRPNVVGSWYGIGGAVGTLVVRASHAYVCKTIGRVAYRVKGVGLCFTGALKGWDKGHGRRRKGVLVFDGGSNYFVFEKG